jgi:hypothetical protein
MEHSLERGVAGREEWIHLTINRVVWQALTAQSRNAVWCLLGQQLLSSLLAWGGRRQEENVHNPPGKGYGQDCTIWKEPSSQLDTAK